MPKAEYQSMPSVFACDSAKARCEVSRCAGRVSVDVYTGESQLFFCAKHARILAEKITDKLTTNADSAPTPR